MRIAFVDPISWTYTIETPYQQPMGGSQSALCYLAEAIALQGHQVFLLNPVASRSVSRGVTCLPLTVESLQELQRLPLDALVVLNAADGGRKIKPLLQPDTTLILWTQHASDQVDMQPLHEPDGRDVYDAIAVVSQWQQQQIQQTFGIHPDRLQVLGNAIAPCFTNRFPGDRPILSSKTQPPVLAYTSTPFRGLDLLLDIFPLIRQAVPGTRLKVFSSLKVYQIAAEQDHYAHLYQRCRDTEGVEYIGSLPQPALVEELQQVTALTYPNIYPETFCTSVLEAMACGCQIITSHLAALPETTAGFARLIPINGTVSPLAKTVELTPAARTDYINHFVRETVEILHMAQSATAEMPEASLQRQVSYIQQNCTWSIRAQAWIEWLTQLSY